MRTTYLAEKLTFARAGPKSGDSHVFSEVRGKALRGGYIVVIHNHGRNGHYHPHLHIIATSGGWDRQASQWVHLDYTSTMLTRDAEETRGTHRLAAQPLCVCRVTVAK